MTRAIQSGLDAEPLSKQDLEKSFLKRTFDSFAYRQKHPISPGSD
jgi:hypothetical protein